MRSVRTSATPRSAIPIAHTFGLEDWRTAMEISLSGHAPAQVVATVDDRDPTGRRRGRRGCTTAP